LHTSPLPPRAYPAKLYETCRDTAPAQATGPVLPR